MRIENVSKKDYSQLIEIWETSVRSTHDFLTEKDIISLRSLIIDKYFPAVDQLPIFVKRYKQLIN